MELIEIDGVSYVTTDYYSLSPSYTHVLISGVAHRACAAHFLSSDVLEHGYSKGARISLYGAKELTYLSNESIMQLGGKFIREATIEDFVKEPLTGQEIKNLKPGNWLFAKHGTTPWVVAFNPYDHPTQKGIYATGLHSASKDRPAAYCPVVASEDWFPANVGTALHLNRKLKNADRPPVKGFYWCRAVDNLDVWVVGYAGNNLDIVRVGGSDYWFSRFIDYRRILAPDEVKANG
jgi:hypothetical protein